MSTDLDEDVVRLPLLDLAGISDDVRVAAADEDLTDARAPYGHSWNQQRKQ